MLGARGAACLRSSRGRGSGQVWGPRGLSWLAAPMGRGSSLNVSQWPHFPPPLARRPCAFNVPLKVMAEYFMQSL